MAYQCILPERNAYLSENFRVGISFNLIFSLLVFLKWLKNAPAIIYTNEEMCLFLNMLNL